MSVATNGHIEPEALPILGDDQIGYARIVSQVVSGEEVPQPKRDALPAHPVDWHGITSRLHATPDVSHRSAMLSTWIAGQSYKPHDQDRIRQALKLAAETPPDALSEPPKFRLPIMGAVELARTRFKVDWLIKGFLVADQPAIIGGPKKGQKSNTMIDLAVSIASGRPFLNHFEVPNRLPVLMLSGESGGFATQDMAIRACQAKGVNLEDLEGYLFIGLELPKLSIEEQVKYLVEIIIEHKIKVVIIDPLYLCLTSGAINGKVIDTKNLFEVGPLLLQVSRMCLDAGATPLLIHHNKITSEPYDLPELGNLAFAGIQEFARQWILLGRRSRYVPGSGKHDLWLTAGGSCGHSGEWALDIDEGVLDEDFGGRIWNPSVRYASELCAAERDAKAGEKKAKQVAAEMEKASTFKRDEEKVIEAVRKLEGKGSRSKICEAAGLNSANGNAAITRCELDGRLIVMPVQVPKGKGTTTQTGVGFPELRHTPTYSD